MSTPKKRGRPIKHGATGNQTRAIQARLEKGMSVAKIAAELNMHEFAVLRVKRNSR